MPFTQMGDFGTRMCHVLVNVHTLYVLVAHADASSMLSGSLVVIHPNRSAAVFPHGIDTRTHSIALIGLRLRTT